MKIQEGTGRTVITSYSIHYTKLYEYSAGFDPIDKINSGLYKKQILWFIIGMVFLLFLSVINYKQLGDYALYIYGAMFLVLVVTTFFGRPIRGTSAWLSFGIFSIQPSEFMKLASVILLAKYLELIV